MIMKIHSCYGVLTCTPLELQAIEKSIPEHESNKQLSEVTVGDGPADSVFREESGNVTDGAANSEDA